MFYLYCNSNVICFDKMKNVKQSNLKNLPEIIGSSFPCLRKPPNYPQHKFGDHPSPKLWNFWAENGGKTKSCPRLYFFLLIISQTIEIIYGYVYTQIIFGNFLIQIYFPDISSYNLTPDICSFKLYFLIKIIYGYVHIQIIFGYFLIQIISGYIRFRAYHHVKNNWGICYNTKHIGKTFIS